MTDAERVGAMTKIVHRMLENANRNEFGLMSSDPRKSHVQGMLLILHDTEGIGSDDLHAMMNVIATYNFA